MARSGTRGERRKERGGASLRELLPAARRYNVGRESAYFTASARTQGVAGVEIVGWGSAVIRLSSLLDFLQRHLHVTTRLTMSRTTLVRDLVDPKTLC